MLRSPLHELHAVRGARLVDFAGWELPLQFEGIITEHRAVRSAAGLFDVSHMGQLFFHGPQAAEFLAWMTTGNLALLAPGECRYCHLLDEQGHIVDDAIAYRLDADELLLVPNAATTTRVEAWLMAHLDNFDAMLENRSMELACLALQGPDAPRLLQDEVGLVVEPFRVVRHGEMLVSGTGYTGESGYEIIVSAAEASPIWEALLQRGAVPCGLGARDTLRLERGMLLSGSDFDGSQTPLEAGCEWVIDWEHDFLGRDALIAQRERGEYTQLHGVRLEQRGVPRPGCAVFHTGERIGTLTSGTLSPSLGIGIGLAYLPLSPGTEVAVEVRGKHLSGRVVRPPFQ